MNYSLAKQLKEAGFPQKGYGMPYSIVVSLRGDEIALDGKENVYYYPTLSELIEACGERFGSLHSCLNTEKKVVSWLCSALYEPYPTGKGPTPEEAVAALWLALNKK